MSVEVLMFGAHPDDVEWGVGGTALLLRERQISFGIIDLTEGEMGSRGTPHERAREAIAAAEFVGAQFRANLNLPDGALIDSPDNRKKIAAAIRQHRPRLVLGPYWEDRHPDHAAAGMMLRNAALYCASSKGGDPNPPHKPAAFLYYLLHNFGQPTFVCDISGVYARKLELLRIHESQFSKTADEFGVVALGMSDYLFGLESRDRFHGSLVGVHHGEALVSERPFRLNGLERFLDLLV
jgi:bacillithiol biosynthesis deacetylase BshB1